MNPVIILIIVIIVIVIVVILFMNQKNKGTQEPPSQGEDQGYASSSTKIHGVKPKPLQPANIEQEDTNLDNDAVYRYRYTGDGEVSQWSDEYLVQAQYKFFPSFIVPSIPGTWSVEIQRKTLAPGTDTVIQDWTRMKNGIWDKELIESVNSCLLDQLDVPPGYLTAC